jgi:MFS transporter, SP family, solute carrier family 2 (myo-inositol transporter), member 13
MSGGFIGIVVPLYLAECLSASNRGKGTGIFQWLLTLGIVAAALVGMYFSYRVASGGSSRRRRRSFAFQRPGLAQNLLGLASSRVLFVLGSLMVTESPRWLFRAGKKRALAALLRSRTPQQAEILS